MNYFTTLETKKRTPSFFVSSSKTKHNNLEKSNRRLPAIIEADIGGDKIIYPRKNRGGEYSFFLSLSSWFHAVHACLPLFERALIPITAGTSRRIETRKTQNEGRLSLWKRRIDKRSRVWWWKWQRGCYALASAQALFLRILREFRSRANRSEAWERWASIRSWVVRSIVFPPIVAPRSGRSLPEKSTRPHEPTDTSRYSTFHRGRNAGNSLLTPSIYPSNLPFLPLDKFSLP